MMPNHRTFTFTAALWLLATPMLALADVPPPNSCTTAGAACNDAPSDGGWTGAGACYDSTCTHMSGTGTVSSSCLLCLAGPPSPPPPGHACTIGAVNARDIAPFGLVAMGVALLAATRRRGRQQ